MQPAWVMRWIGEEIDDRTNTIVVSRDDEYAGILLALQDYAPSYWGCSDVLPELIYTDAWRAADFGSWLH